METKSFLPFYGFVVNVSNQSEPFIYQLLTAAAKLNILPVFTTQG
jgi:hypothetical protein